MTDCPDEPISTTVQNTITGVVSEGEGSLPHIDPLSVRGLPRHNYPRPVAPRNFFVSHILNLGRFDLYWDSPYIDPRNSTHNIIGVNLYRSIDSSEGPWTLLTGTPLNVSFYRDQSQNISVVGEVINNSTNLHINDRHVVCKVNNFPIVTSVDNQDLLTDPDGVIVTVDGEQVRPKSINPLTGEIEFYTVPQYDIINQRFFDLKIPTSSSVITIDYVYCSLFIQNRDDIDQRVFYKITSVSSDGKETALEDAPTASYQNLDAMFYIWKNAISKNQFLLEQGGEKALIYVQKTAGEKCSEHDVVDSKLYGDDQWRNCKTCFGTGFVGGYIGPFEVYIAPFDAETSYRYTNKGRVVSKNQETFIMNFPVLKQGDILVRRNGERYLMGPIRRKEPNGVLVQQNFTVHIIQPSDILYSITEFGNYNPQEVVERESVPDYKEEKGKSPTFYNWHKSNV